MLNKKLYNERYRRKHHEEILEKQRQRRKDNSDYSKQWRKDNPNYTKEWRENHPGYDKNWRENNGESCKKTKENFEKNHPGYEKQWCEKNPERQKQIIRRQKLKKYNLSYKDWLAMWGNQDGKCAICGEPFAEHSEACIDHDHNYQTGEIRGLLCRKCNAGLGLFNDDYELTTRATEYLLKGFKKPHLELIKEGV